MKIVTRFSSLFTIKWSTNASSAATRPDASLKRQLRTNLTNDLLTLRSKTFLTTSSSRQRKRMSQRPKTVTATNHSISFARSLLQQ